MERLAKLKTHISNLRRGEGRSVIRPDQWQDPQVLSGLVPFRSYVVRHYFDAFDQPGAPSRFVPWNQAHR